MMSDIQFSFATHADLAEAMCRLAESGKVVYAALFYEDARALLKELAYFDEVTFGNIDIEDPQWGGYKREYYVYVDDEYNVGVEPAWREKEGTDKESFIAKMQIARETLNGSVKTKPVKVGSKQLDSTNSSIKVNSDLNLSNKSITETKLDSAGSAIKNNSKVLSDADYEYLLINKIIV